MSLQAELIRVAMRLFIRSSGKPEISMTERREQMRGHTSRVPKPPKDTTTIERPLGGVPAVRVTRPLSRSDRLILFLHGGGYSTGSFDLYRHITWRFADAARATVVAIDYRLAPEHPFPAGLDDSVAAWQALLADGADPRRTALLGDSAGGGLAFALALRARDENLPLPAAIVAMSPWTDLAITGHSAKPGARDPMLRAADVAYLAQQYLAGADPRNPYASPLYGDLSGLPPSLLQVGGDEILRDDAVRMAQKLNKAGSPATLEIWRRMPHVWHAFAPIMPEARQAIARIGDFLRQALSLARWSG